jgi:phospholipase/lecithinase/hemolysin
MEGGGPARRNGHSRLTSAREREVVKSILLSCAAAALLLSANTTHAAITELVIFGDSLSDAGNDLAAFGVPGPPYYSGRFSDGPVWVDQLATQLGIPVAVASELGGLNYAYGGAETGDGFDHNFGVIPNMGMQIDDYLGSHSPSAGQLFVVFGGHNNFRNGETDATVPVADMVDHITELATAGATDFMVSTLMPLGQLPESAGGPNEAALDALSVDFNTLLAPALANLRTTLGVRIYEFDTYSVMQDMLNNPGAYGLTNVTDPALVGMSVVPNPDEYLFWDDVHPTTVAHAPIADAAFASIPEPSALVLLALGLCGMLGYVRGRGTAGRHQ